MFSKFRQTYLTLTRPLVLLLSSLSFAVVNTPANAKMTTVQPIVFLSHGAGPSFFLDAKQMPVFKGLDKDSKAADFLRNFAKTISLTRPEAILVISAHWENQEATVNTNTNHTLYFDYYNFPPETYKLQWPARGAPEVAKKAAKLLTSRGLACREDSTRGLDHGVFVPLKVAFPEAEIPGKASLA